MKNSTKTSPIQKGTTYVAVSVLALAIVVCVFFLTKKATPEQVADSIAEMTFGQQPGWALDYIPDTELQNNRIARSDLPRIVREGIHPIAAGLKLQSIQFDHYRGSRAIMGLASVSGGSGSQPFEVFVTESSGRPATSLGELVRQAWVVRYLHEKNVPLSERSFYAAIIDGVDRDAKRLESLGLKGSTVTVTPDGSPPRLWTWESMRKRSVRKLAELRA